MERLMVKNGNNLMNSEREAWGKALASGLEDGDSKGPVPGTQALWKGLTVLKLISESPKEQRFSDLMDISGLPKGTLHRILQALIEFRFLRYDQQEQTYKLGTRLFEMAHKVWSDFDLRGAAEPELQRLQKISTETARLGLLDEGGVLIIDQKESPKPLRLELGVGKKVQLHASAMGKAMLAHLPPTELAETLSSLELMRYSANTITNFDEFSRHLDLVKARGYAISVEEQFHGISSVSAPILDYYGKPIGAVSIVGGSYSLSVERLHSLGREVIESARRIAGNIGESYMSISNKRRPSMSGSNQWECVVSSNAFLGEGPHWNEEQQYLEWVDILEPSVHVSRPEKGQDTSFNVSEIIGAIVPRRRGGHVAVTQLGYRAVDLATGKMSTLATPDDMEGCRFNDGKCDPKGRFWAGTLALDASPNKGALYCLEPNGKLRKVMPNLHISNGLGWNADASKMYLVDSGKREIYEFDYDLASGTLSNQRIFAKLNEDEGSPDGMAVDVEGGVWCAIWDGWKIIRFDSDGIIDRIIELPVPRPTSCAFGGKDLKTLYVTSAKIRLSSEMLAEAPLSGAIFAIDVEVSGVPVSCFAG